MAHGHRFAIRAVITGAFIMLFGIRATIGHGQQASAILKYPREGDVLAGIVSIQGTASAPGFTFYYLEYTPSPVSDTSIWQEIMPASNIAVDNGLLGTWDTTAVTDGTYTLRLRVQSANADDISAIASITISNTTPTPAATDPPPADMAGGLPTIEQPPTRTPRPGISQQGDLSDGQLDATLLDPQLVRQGVCIGGLGGGVAFMLMAAYAMYRAGRRGELHSIITEIRTDYLRTLFPGRKRDRKHK